MKQTLLNLRTSLWLLTLPIVVLMIIAFMTITGCDEAGMVEPVVPVDNGTKLEPVEPVEPTTEPTEPTTNGDVKKPEEPTEPEPTEPVEPEPKPDPASTVTLPPGYELPPELIPARPPTLSANEAALIEADKWIQQNQPDFDATAPKLQTQAGHTADLMSLLPYQEREEVYDLFVASVNLPSFAEAAEKMKETDIQLGVLFGEAYKTGNWDAFWDYQQKTSIERGYLGQDNLTLLADIYFEENPQDAPYRDGTGHSSYWIVLEYYRLQLENPNLPNLYQKINPVELLKLFRQSCRNGHVFGLDNPWD